jgi:transcriptional regulator with XRE-family HTH domain
VMQLIGDKIRTLRRKRGWSQERLGELVGFSQSKISKIENGDWDSLSDLRLIAKALGVKLKELIDDEPDGGGYDEKEDAAADERS